MACTPGLSQRRHSLGPIREAQDQEQAIKRGASAVFSQIERVACTMYSM